jgi:hypothetical protein
MKRVFKSWRVRLTAALAAVSLLLVAICFWYRAGNAKAASPTDLKDLISKRGSVTFRSWNGVWIGTDCDTEITFLTNQVAWLIEYRDAIDRYKGTYQIDPEGQITIHLDDPGKKWPVMVLEHDSTSLRLRPRTRSWNFMRTRPFEATIWDGQDSYWPFRPVTEDEEASIQRADP